MTIKSQLNIRDLRSNVILGVKPKERSESQEISINIKIDYASLPKGCVDDNVKHTICYDELCSIVIEVSKNKSYKLIEHMSFVILESIKEFFHHAKKEIKYNEIAIEVIKLSPPIFALKNGASFIITEKIEKI
jgi:FolB domain-containing protein